MKTLLDYDAEVTVVSPEIIAEIKGLNPFQIYQTNYRAEFCRGKFLVIAATDNYELNKRIYNDGHRAGALVNVVDQIELCDFIFPAVVKRGLLQIAISSSGKSPALAKRLREELEGKYNPDLGKSLEILGEVRALIMEEVADREKRKKIFAGLAELADNLSRHYHT